MKKIKLTTYAVLIMALFSVTVAAQTTETRNLSGFTKVAFGVPGNLNIRIGSEFKVVLEGNKDFLAEIETKISDDRLNIKIKNVERGWFSGRGSKFNNEKVVVNITMPAISSLSVSGSGNAEVFDSFKTGSLSLDLSGSGRLIVSNISGKDLSCKVSGSGNININGNNSFDKVDLGISGSGRITLNNMLGEDLNCRISGSGNININGNGSFDKADISTSGSGGYSGESLKLATAKVSISGSGKCNCYVSEVFNANVSGSGSITYSGSPKVIDTKVSGSGKIRTN